MTALEGGPFKRAARRWSRRMFFRLLQDNPGVEAKRFPLDPNSHSYFIPKTDVAPSSAGGLRVPPQSLWLGYGQTQEQYLEGGRADVARMQEILSDSGATIADAMRVLEIGCAAGRLIRWWEPWAGRCEIWGVDISAQHILWCQQNLSPPFRFSGVTTSPHLPFEDRSFDLVYAGSVFTHIGELPDAWLLEVRRILEPGGHAYLTVHDKPTLETMRSKGSPIAAAAESEIRRLRAGDYGMFVLQRSLSAVQVFYDLDFLKQTWGRFFEVIATVPRAYSDIQTAVVLRKPGGR